MDDSHIPVRETEVKIPFTGENIREELNFFRELRELFRAYDKPSGEIDFIIRNLEDQILEFDRGNPVLPDQKQIMDAIAKHPYFKNPCDYPIRLLTILKYLKRRGFNLNYADIDIYVDRVIQKMEGIKKVGRGRYIKETV